MNTRANFCFFLLFQLRGEVAAAVDWKRENATFGVAMRRATRGDLHGQSNNVIEGRGERDDDVPGNILVKCRDFFFHT